MIKINVDVAFELGELVYSIVDMDNTPMRVFDYVVRADHIFYGCVYGFNSYELFTKEQLTTEKNIE